MEKNKVICGLVDYAEVHQKEYEEKEARIAESRHTAVKICNKYYNEYMSTSYAEAFNTSYQVDIRMKNGEVDREDLVVLISDAVERIHEVGKKSALICDYLVRKYHKETSSLFITFDDDFSPTMTEILDMIRDEGVDVYSNDIYPEDVEAMVATIYLICLTQDMLEAKKIVGKE